MAVLGKNGLGWRREARIGSAKAPTATATTSGLRRGSQTTVEPQVGQNRKLTGKPLSDGRS
ncbi:MAG: hypothetical protein JF625_26155 [Inquilinus limosus]|uniref:Uncharacterized protein n=1 Tax=Inquilinus limosus TaxID=171674 RepID=A0A952KHM9_9PROT|nr:hypothetical protein [Inquilinus limosus]